MASNLKLKTTTRNSMLDQLNTAIGAGGFLRIYDGTQPTDADTALGAQVQLAQLALSASPFASASGGSVSANAITDDASADATGTATWGSFVTSAGVRILDFSVGTASADLIFPSVSFVATEVISVSSFTFGLP